MHLHHLSLLPSVFINNGFKMSRTAIVTLRYYGFLHFTVDMADYCTNREVDDVSISDPVLSRT